MIDIATIVLRNDRIIVQELTTSKIGSLFVPFDTSHGMQALVLSVAQDDRSTLCADIYPRDVALLRDGAVQDHLGDRMFVFSAVDVWGVIRDGVPMPVNHYLMVRVDSEKDDVDASTGLWTPTEARDFPATGWVEWEGEDVHVHYNTLGSQRRIKMDGQVYAFMERETLTGLVD